jgi:putative phage-type endonuclease
MLVDDLVQQTPEWLEMRKGMATGSMVRDAIAKMKTQPKEGPTKYQQCRENYLFDIVATRLTGDMPDRYVSRAMEFGTENEPLAISAYEQHENCLVEPVGFAFHPKIKWFGASPDGLVGDDGSIEVKCPTSATHLQWIIDGCVPDEHIPQMKAVMACAEREWCDFVSFDPRMPEHLKLFIRRLERDEPMILEMEKEVEKFLAETQHMLEVIKKKQPSMRPPL